MQRNITFIRALGTEFIARKLRSLSLVALLVGVVALALSLWLTTINVWWWLLAAPVVVLVITGVLIYIVLRFFLRVLRPVLTDKQKQDAGLFVDKLERVTENVQTPMPLIMFRVIKDSIWPGKEPFIATLAHDSTTLRQDFVELQKSF